MTKKRRNVVTADKVDEQALIAAMESQGNAIPVAIATVLRMVAPIIARLAIRYVARKARKKISDATVNTASSWIGSKIQDIIKKAEEESISHLKK